MELAASTSTASGSLAQHGHALQLVRPVGPFFPVRVLWQRIRRPEQKPRNNSALVSAKEQAGELANEVPGASLGMSKVEAHCADYGSICSTTSQQQKGPAQHDSQQHAPGPRLVRPVRFIGRMLRAAWRQVGNGARAVARHVRPQVGCHLCGCVHNSTYDHAYRYIGVESAAWKGRGMAKMPGVIQQPLNLAHADGCIGPLRSSCRARVTTTRHWGSVC